MLIDVSQWKINIKIETQLLNIHISNYTLIINLSIYIDDLYSKLNFGNN